MSCTAREFVMLVKESALGVPMAAPVAGTDSLYIRLTDGNAFNMSAAPVFEFIPYGGGLAIDADAISDHYECKAQLKTKLYPSQAKFLLDWATTRVDDAGALPWPTDMPCGDLASCSIYHAVQRGDGSFQRKRAAGGKVTGVTVEVSRGSTTANLTLDVQACKMYGNKIDVPNLDDPDDTEFPDPDDVNFPTGPYTFKQTGGELMIGTVRSMYEDLSWKATNTVDGRWFESASLLLNQFTGRQSTLDATFYFREPPNDQDDMESLAALSAKLGFTNGVTGQHLVIDFRGKNRITALPFDLPLDKAFTRKLTLKNLYDAAFKEDFHFAMS